jgi:hypothetical protein
MPSAYVIDSSRRLVLSRSWGVVTGEDVLTLIQATVTDPHFHPDFSQLVDMRAVTEVEVTTDFVRLFVAKSNFGAGSRRALVAGSDVVYGMARIYGTLLDGRPGEFRIFRDLQPALEWLGFSDESDELRALLAAAPPLDGELPQG